MGRRRSRSGSRRSPRDRDHELRARTAIALGVAALAFGFRFALLTDGLAFEAEAAIAASIDGRAAALVPADRTSTFVSTRPGATALAAALDAITREWLGTSRVDRTMLVAGAGAGALGAAAVTFLAFALGLGRAPGALAGIALALLPHDVAAGASGSFSGVASAAASIGFGFAALAGRRRSAALAAAAGAGSGLAVAFSAAALPALVTAALCVVLTGERRRALTLAFVTAIIPGIVIGARGIVALLVLARTESGGGAGDALTTLVFALGPLGVVMLIAGAGASLARGRRALAIPWLLGTLVISNAHDVDLVAASAPPIAILLAGAVLERRRRTTFLVVMASVVVSFAGRFQTLAYRHDRVGPVLAARALLDRTPPDALVVTAEPAYTAYYGRREARAWPPRTTLAIDDASRARELVEGLVTSVRGGRTVACLRSALVETRGRTLEEALRARFVLEEVHRLESESGERRVLSLARFDEVLYVLTQR